MKVAIIGSGIAGLSSAFHLDKAGHQCTIFEKANYFGGHTDTNQLDIDGKKINIDSGFIVFAREYYPYFHSMLDELEISSKATKMSFSANNEDSGLTYNATNLNKLFCQRKNLVSLRFYRMIFDIIRFYQSANQIINYCDNSLTTEEYFKQKRYSNTFLKNHIYPMISALWSTPTSLVKQFPIKFLVEYLSAHGMMNLWSRPSWQVLNNGSFEYINTLKHQLQNTQWHLNCGVTNVIRDNEKVLIHTTRKEPEQFDSVVMACHADQAKIILQKPSKNEAEILGAIGFEQNDITIHTDENMMPKEKLAWASWNTRVSEDLNNKCSATYWMNELQGLQCSTNVFVSLNEKRVIAKDKILSRKQYFHPTYTVESVNARKRISEINGQQRTAYAGAYWGWAFHEDGARTGYEAASLLMEKYTD